MDEDTTRASDDEREQTVVELREHLVAGRLTLEEFSERVELAYRARTGTDLVAANSALPAVREGPRRRRPVRATIGLFAHVIRRGRLRIGRRSAVLSALADVDFDLREAEVAGLDTTVVVFALFGNVDLYVPGRIAIDVGGVSVLGHRRQWGRETADADAPLLRVLVFSLFGTVDVWHVPSDVRGTYSDVIKAVRQGQRELPG